jgi:hypothetical protein
MAYPTLRVPYTLEPYHLFFLVPVKEDVTFAVTVHFNYPSALRANCKSDRIDSLSIFNESQNARHILLLCKPLFKIIIISRKIIYKIQQISRKIVFS